MGFVVLPALVGDICAVYDVYFAAFKDNPVTKALFPSVTTAEMTNGDSEFRKGHTAHTLHYWSTDPTQYTTKCVDIKTGKVVGMALWDIYLTPSTWRRPEISWLSGHEREHAEALITPLWDAREKFWLNQKYIYCHVVAVHPDYQRNGIGQLLMEYGIGIAQEVELPLYVESSLDGVRLYEKMKCQRLVHDSNPPKGLGITGTTERRSAEGNPELALFVHVPRGAEGKVPAAIKFR